MAWHREHGHAASIPDRQGADRPGARTAHRLALKTATVLPRWPGVVDSLMRSAGVPVPGSPAQVLWEAVESSLERALRMRRWSEPPKPGPRRAEPLRSSRPRWPGKPERS